MCHNTRGLRRGCLVSFGNRRALIWITQICHSALFCISPERFSSSSPLLSSLALSVCLFLSYSCGPYHAWGDVHKVSSQNCLSSLTSSLFKSFLAPPLLPLFPVIIEKRRVEIWIPFMADSPVCSWNVPPVDGRHIWRALAMSCALLNILWPFVCHFWQCCHWLWNPEESVWPSYISISLLLDYHRFSWPLSALLY